MPDPLKFRVLQFGHVSQLVVCNIQIFKFEQISFENAFFCSLQKEILHTVDCENVQIAQPTEGSLHHVHKRAAAVKPQDKLTPQSTSYGSEPNHTRVCVYQ